MANNVNVSFLKGTQSGFDGLTSYKAGAFYLTTDTNRLYFADSTSKANYLNKYVHTVKTKAMLDQAITNGDIVNGDFAYVSDLNALVVVKGSTYVQVNQYQNDNDDTKTTKLTFTKTNVADDATEIVFNYELAQETKKIDGTKITLSPVTGSFSITAADIKAIIDTAVGVQATLSGATATINTTGTGSAGSGFTVKGSGSVRVSGEKNAIVIDGTNTTYTLDSPAGESKITLNGTDSSKKSVEITAGTDIVVSGSTAGQIEVGHKAITTTPTTSNKQATNNGNFSVVSSITTDNGHITGYNTQTITLPKAPEYEITDITGANNGKLSITLKDKTTNSSKTVSSDADFYHIVGKDHTTKVYNQNDLNVYTIDEIDEKLKAVNAMAFKGTVGSTAATVTSLPNGSSSQPVAIGDTYMTDTDGTFGGVACQKGDLLIATIAAGSTENANNTIPEGKIVWVRVPSGNDYDAKFSLVRDTANNKITLEEDVVGTNKGSVQFISNNDAIVITSSNSGTAMKMNIDHKAYADPSSTPASLTTTSSGTFKAITGVTTDKGHITGFTETTYTLPKEKDSQYDLKTVASGKTNKAVIQLAGRANTDDAGSTDNVYLIAGTDLTNSTNTTSGEITFNHKTYNAPTTSTGTGTLGTDSSQRSTITAVTSVETSNGHVTKVNSSTFSLPKDSKYSLSGAAIDSGVTIGSAKGLKITNTLSGTASSGAAGEKTTSVFSVVSETLTLTAKTDSSNKAAYQIDLVWGDF